MKLLFAILPVLVTAGTKPGTLGGPGLPNTYLTPSLPPYTPLAESKHCKLSWSVTYEDPFGPIFTENRYTCSFHFKNMPIEKQAPMVVPAPYDRLSGQRGGDPQIASSGVLKSTQADYEQQLLAATQEHKTTITSFGCSPFPDAKQLDEHRYSNLFWGVRELKNQTCLEPGEVSEFMDVRRPWTADWRFTIANRGDEKNCEWYMETGNVAEALHYYCFYTNVGVGENSGGVEAVSWGRSKKEEGDLRWCVRYNDRGWDEELFDEHCLGV